MILMETNSRVIELCEFEPLEVERRDLPIDAAELLRQYYHDRVKVEAISFRSDSNWKLTSLGVVGYLPLTPEVGFRLLPKVPIENIFRMLEYAYDLSSFHLLQGLVDCSSLEDFYDRLARLLAIQVLNRGRRGFYRSYQKRSDELPFVRGRLDLRSACQKPWDTKIACHFEEHTSDVEENRIIAWTLLQILHSGLCSEQSLPLVRQAYRRLAGFAQLSPFRAEECIARHYSRLNQDYQPMHALCRFFLEHRGPGHEAGDRKMVPFLVKMDRLYELFVARWLEKNLQGERYSIQSQEHVLIDQNLNINFRIDLSIFDRESHSCAFVIDTKYKAGSPATDDIEQVAAYAEAKGCKEAILVYPECSGSRLEGRVGKIRVRGATFSLSEDPEIAGRRFAKESLGIEID